MTRDALVGLVRHPHGPAFTIVLVCHVAAALVALLAMVASGVEGARLAFARGEPAASVRAYFAPGVNWPGRALYLVPLLGAALLAMSGGAFRVGDDWVLSGLGLWVLATGIAEVLVWPAERRVQALLAGGGGAAQAASSVRRSALVLCASAALVAAILLAAMVVMVAKP